MANKKFDLQEYVKSIRSADTPLKEDKYIVLNDAVQAVLGLPGFPLGHVTQLFGLSDSGKTSLIYHAGAQAQAQKILPVYIISEGKVNWDRAKKMGLDSDNCVIENATYLEDIFKKIDRIVTDVNNGKLQMDVMIFVDSIGNTVSLDSVKENKDGTLEVGGAMMKASRVLRENMRVYSHRINNTRKVSSPYTVGLTFVNHAYRQPPTFPGGPTTLVPYGGDGIYLASSLVIRTKKSQVLRAVVDGKQMGFGIISKLQVDKNHLTNVTQSGEFVITEDAIIPNHKDAIAEYKESHKHGWIEVEDDKED
jgi:RecA/RadA recombinase